MHNGSPIPLLAIYVAGTGAFEWCRRSQPDLGAVSSGAERLEEPSFSPVQSFSKLVSVGSSRLFRWALGTATRNARSAAACASGKGTKERYRSP